MARAAGLHVRGEKSDPRNTTLLSWAYLDDGVTLSRYATRADVDEALRDHGQYPGLAPEVWITGGTAEAPWIVTGKGHTRVGWAADHLKAAQS